MNATIHIRPTTSKTRSQELALTDEQLLVQYRRTGDREVFALLVRRYERELYNYLRRYLNDADMAEDVFQTTFLQVHLKCETFEEGRRFRPWLYTVATNQAIDAQRRNRRHRAISLDRTGCSDDGEEVGALIDLLISDAPNPLAEASSEECKAWVTAALDELSEPLRQVLYLVYYQGLKYREAADVLGIPVGTVKSRIHTAVFKLNEIWNIAHVEDN